MDGAMVAAAAVVVVVGSVAGDSHILVPVVAAVVVGGDAAVAVAAERGERSGAGTAVVATTAGAPCFDPDWTILLNHSIPVLPIDRGDFAAAVVVAAEIAVADVVFVAAPEAFATDAERPILVDAVADGGPLRDPPSATPGLTGSPMGVNEKATAGVVSVNGAAKDVQQCLRSSDAGVAAAAAAAAELAAAPEPKYPMDLESKCQIWTKYVPIRAETLLPSASHPTRPDTDEFHYVETSGDGLALAVGTAEQDEDTEPKADRKLVLATVIAAAAAHQ